MLRSTREVEVLRASPVNNTGVQTTDLVGCPQNDKLLFFVAPEAWRFRSEGWIRFGKAQGESDEIGESGMGGGWDVGVERYIECAGGEACDYV